jgi:hypothetical protein
MNNIQDLKPFKRLCVTIGNLPTAYIESMSYYECITYLVNYLTREVVPTVNNNSEVVKELQSYVEHYFDNLDVQEEINNKLDEMAESGQLAEIIGQYIELNGVLAYNTVNDLKNAHNLVNGSFAKTSGYYSFNDGGGAYYKIRELNNTDVIDNYTLFGLTNFDNLVAELIPQFKMSVKQFGAKGDGLTDDTQALQNAIEFNTFGTLYFDKGSYLISTSLKTYIDNIKQCNIEMEKTTILKTNSNLDCLIELGGLGGNSESINLRHRYIKGGILDATNCESGIKINEGAMGILIEGIEIKSFNTYGIYVPKDSNNYSSDLSIISCYINGKGSEYNNYGIYFERPDNNLENLRLNALHTCIYAEAGGQFIINCHGLGVGNSNNWFNNTKFLHLKTSSLNEISNCYCDTLQTFIYNEDNSDFTLVDSVYYSYINNVNTKLFIIDSSYPRYIIKNCNFTLPTPSNKNQGLIFNNFNIQNCLNPQKTIIEDVIISNSQTLEDGDLILNTNKSYQPYWLDTSVTLDDTKWLKLGYITTGLTWNNILLNIEGYIFNLNFRLQRTESNTNLTQRTSYKINENVTLALGVKYINNDRGYNVYALYLKQDSGTALRTDITIKQINNSASFIPIKYELDDPSLETLIPDAQYQI